MPGILPWGWRGGGGGAGGGTNPLSRGEVLIHRKENSEKEKGELKYQGEARGNGPKNQLPLTSRTAEEGQFNVLALQ